MFWTSYDKTRWMSSVGDKNKRIRLWLRSGFRSSLLGLSHICHGGRGVSKIYGH